MTLVRLIRLVPLAALLTACASAPGPLTPTPAGPLSSPLLPATPAVDETVIRYERSGGIAGRTTAWTIYANGRIVDGAGVEAKADPAKLAALLTIARNSKTLALSSPAGRACPDCFKYAVTIQTPGASVSLVTYDGVTNPPELDALLLALAEVTR